MKVTSVTVVRGFTANIGNYNNVRFELGMEADLTEGETPDEAVAMLDKMVGDQVALRKRQINEWLKQKYGGSNGGGNTDNGGDQS